MPNLKALMALLQRANATFNRDMATWHWKVYGIERRKTERQQTQTRHPMELTGEELLARLRELNERVEPSVAMDTGTAGQEMPVVHRHDAATQM